MRVATHQLPQESGGRLMRGIRECIGAGPGNDAREIQFLVSAEGVGTFPQLTCLTTPICEVVRLLKQSGSVVVGESRGIDCVVVLRKRSGRTATSVRHISFIRVR